MTTEATGLEQYLEDIFAKSYSIQTVAVAPSSTGSSASSIADILEDFIGEGSNSVQMSEPPLTTSFLLSQVTFLQNKCSSYEQMLAETNDKFNLVLQVMAQQSTRLAELETLQKLHAAPIDSLSIHSTADISSPKDDSPDQTRARRKIEEIPPPTPFEFFAGPDKTLDFEISHSYKSSTTLLAKNIPYNQYEHVSAADCALDSIMAMFLPQIPQKCYRDSAIAFTQRQVRRELKCNLFEAGLHAISCFLPDDKLVLSIMARRVQHPSWHQELYSRLNQLSQPAQRFQPHSHQSISDRTGEEDDENDEEEPDLIMNHVVKKVSILANQDNTEYRVMFMLDSAAEVEVLASGRGDLVVIAFLQEFAVLVGKDHLFKRSLCLVKAWWRYETKAYGVYPAELSQFLPDLVIAVMLVAVFNRYSSEINYPLQALSIFIAEYADLGDWSTIAITLQGVVPMALSDQSTTQPPTAGPIQAPIPSLSHPVSTDLVTPEMQLKYWELYTLTGPFGHNGKKRRVEEDEAHVLEPAAATMPNAPLMSSIHSDTGGSQREGSEHCSGAATDHSGPTVYIQEGSSVLPHVTIQKFKARGINVVHPFSYANMAIDDLTSVEGGIISQVFTQGAARLNNLLASVSALPSSSTEQLLPLFASFFENTVALYQKGFRHDTEGNMLWGTNAHILAKGNNVSDSETEVSPAGHSAVALWNQILYVNLITEQRISESALLKACKAVLNERGTLPVGEIGKTLQEMTSMEVISGRLKETFGGLKKFLEMNAEEFVICIDHPFNPHVLLKKDLTPSEEAQLTSSSQIPPQLLAKFRKVSDWLIRWTL